MNQKLLHTPEGVRDIYGDECERKQIIEQRLHTVLKNYGYRDIETPTFEYFDVFGSDVGTIPSAQLYKFFDREGNTLVLRPDFTPSIARAAGRYFMDSDRPVRLSYLGRTFVNHQEHRGRLKENTEIGAELIGEGSADADAEIIAMAADMLLTSGLSDFQISIGHVAFFESLVKEAGIDEETVEHLRILIHNHNTFGVEKLLSSRHIDERIARILISLPVMNGSVEMLEKAYEMTQGLKAQESVQRLQEVLRLLQIFGMDEHVSFDFGMLSTYMYYTGIIFRGYTYGTGDAVVKGGRYDNLLGHFGKEAPSAGFVVVIGNLMNALSRQKISVSLETRRTLILYTESSRDEAHRMAAAMRQEGRSCELILKDGKTLPEDLTGYAQILDLQEKHG